MTCARCLAHGAAAVRTGRLRAAVSATLQLLLGVMILWFCFFMAGRGLLAIPSSIHEGAIWQKIGAKP